MAVTSSPDAAKEAEVKRFLQAQALDELSKQRPVATVFFRFSHRNEKNKFLAVHEQKILVNDTRKRILSCQKAHTSHLVEDAIVHGIDTVKLRLSQTFLNFFDVYSVVDQTARSPTTKPETMSMGGEGTFVLSIEAQKNIDLICQESTPRIDDRPYGGN